MSTVPVDTERVASGRGKLAQPLSRAFAEQDDRRVHFRLEPVHDACQVGQRKGPEFVGRQHAAPSVEDHEHLGSRIGLGPQAGVYRIGQHPEQAVGGTRLLVQEPFRMHETPRRPAFDHVRRERPRAAGKADQRHPTVQLGPQETYRVAHVTQLSFGIRCGQSFDVAAGAHRPFEARPLPFDEVQPEAHRVRYRQDVGKQDRGVETKTTQGLQGDLAGQLRRAAQREERAGLGARLAVLGQVTSRLAHQPYRSAVDGTPGDRPQQTIAIA